jgi:hypothetical protein
MECPNKQQLEGYDQTHTSLVSAEDWKTQYTKLPVWLNPDILEEAKESS